SLPNEPLGRHARRMETGAGDIRTVRIPSSRWLAYASAGAATALTGAPSVEAEIHYSGRVDVAFPPDEDKSVAFQLEEPGNSIFFAHTVSSRSSIWVDFFGAAGLAGGGL